jgi:hypothetical protein
LLYDRRKIKITEIKQEEKKQADEIQPEYKQQKTQIPKKKEEEFFIKCPDPSKDQMIGDFRNSKKLQIVSGHKIENKECITLYEDTKFIEKYLPSVKDSTTAAGIALVAATTPLLLNLIKPLVKNLIKKLTKKKDKVK